MAIFDVLKDYVPRTSKGNSVPAKIDKEEEKEEFKENLKTTAQPEGTTSFNRKTVITSIIVLGAIFAAAFVYGISTASNHQKKAENKEVQSAVTGQHLQNVPKDYGKDTSNSYPNNDKNKNKIQRPVDNDSEYSQSASRSTSSNTQSYTEPYTRVPQGGYRQTNDQSYTRVPQMQQSQQRASGGMTMEEKIAAEKAKEKMAANQSQISFGIKTEGDAKK